MIAIVDSGGANIASVFYAIKRLGKTAELTADHNKIQSASHVILPGVGSANNAMQKLQHLDLLTTLHELTQPVLGICLGMQLLYDFSAEGNCDGLGIIPGNITKIPDKTGFVIPHMGWNKLTVKNDSVLFAGIPTNNYVYFTHSYIAPINQHTAATTTIVNDSAQLDFASAVEKANYFGTQFHPERSGDTGHEILRNFLRL